MSLFLVRYVDMEQWLALGRSWVEQEEELEGGREDWVEGVGEAEGCSSRQVELEARVEELSHALGKVGEERAELVKALTASEEQVGVLLGEREGRELREEFGRGANKIEGEWEEERAA